MKLRDPFIVDRLWFQPLSEKWLHLVRTWRNEPRCRTQFHDDSVIDFWQQEKWFKDVYLPREETDVIWVFGDLDVSVLGQVSLYNAGNEPGSVTFGRFMVGREDMLGKGYGEKVTRAVLDRAQQLGFNRVELSVKLSNERATRLYLRCGFVERYRSDDTAYMAAVVSGAKC